MKRVVPLVFLFVGILSCNQNKEPETSSVPISFAGSLAPAPEVLTDKSYTWKVGDTTVVERLLTTRTLTKTLPDVKPPVDTVKPPPVDTVVTPPIPPVSGNPVPTTTPSLSSLLDKPLPLVNGVPQMYSPFNSYVQIGKNAPGNVIMDAVNKYNGRNTLKFTLRKTDDLASNGPRSEITLPAKANNITEHLSVKLFLPSDYIKDPQTESLIQWHHTNSDGSPPLALYTQNGQCVIDWIPSFKGNEQSQYLGAYTPGKWYDIYFKVKWSTGSDGLTELWIDGKKLFTRSGRNAFDGQQNYLKYGI